MGVGMQGSTLQLLPHSLEAAVDTVACFLDYLFILKVTFLFNIPRKEGVERPKPLLSEAADVHFLCAHRCFMCFGECARTSDTSSTYSLGQASSGSAARELPLLCSFLWQGLNHNLCDRPPV